MRTKIVSLCVVSLIFTPCANRSVANPVGGSVVGGDANATITGEGTSLTTINQSANRVVINWQDFSIGAGELTRFVQPSATASALNRIVSGNPSLIYGSLQANGRVFVINPNGILVGPNGTIDTKGFVASTLDIPDASFMSGGALIFSGDSAAGIRNEGAIQALGGDVFMIAHTVENAGTISAPDGTVGLAAGAQIQLVQSGNTRLSVLAPSPTAPAANVGVNNLGTVEAASVELKAAGGNIYALAINNGGIVRATGIVNRNGKIYLAASGGNIQNSGVLSANNADGSGGTVVMDGGHNAAAPATVINSGTIEARGAGAGTRGGRVEILGDHVGLFGNALVDASGDAGGGTVLVGGDFQGGNADVQNAERTFVGADARIRADAITQGDGGRVIVWSDDVTRFYGNVSARGGALGGNGGFAEVSGHNFLSYRGLADLQPAGAGDVGTLLLDPKFIVISLAGTDPVAANDEFSENAAGTSTISPADLVTALNAANVTLRASTDITINDAVDASGNALVRDLILRAGRSIFDNASITLRGSFSATINDNGATVAQRDPGAAEFTMAGAGTTIAAPGGITIQAGTLASDSGGASGIPANTGNINLTTLTTRPADAPTGVDAGDITVVNNPAAGRNIAVSGTIDASGSSATQDGQNAGDAGTITINASGAVSVAGINANGGNFSGTGSGNGGNGGAISLAGLNGITLNNNVSSLGGAGSPAGSDGNQSYNTAVILGGDVILSGGAISLSSFVDGARSLTINGSASPTLGGAIGGTTPLVNLVVNSANAIAINQDITAASVDFWSGTDGGGNVTFAAGVDVHADSQFYRAGDGAGTANNGALVNLDNNNPNFRDSTGLAAPGVFSYRQDAAIASGDFPAPTEFGGALPGDYRIRSDDGAVQLPAMVLPGTLQVTANGNITQNGALDVSAGSSSFTVDTAAGADVLLGGQANDFGSQVVTINTANGGTIRDLSFRNVDAAAVSPVLSAVGLRDLTLAFDAAGVNLPTLGLSRDLSVTAAGLVDFVGSGASTVAGVMGITTTAGGISDSGSGSLAVTGTSTLDAGAANDITLNNAGNNFSTVAVTSGRNVTLTDQNAINLGASLTASGDLNVTAGGLVDFTGAGAKSVGGAMAINTTAGGITDSGAGALTVSGATTLSAGSANDITLNNAGNSFAGGVTVNSANNVTLASLGAISLGNLAINGNFGLTAGGLVNFIGAGASSIGGTMGITTSAGGIDDSGAGSLTVGGASTLAAGAGNDITLNNNNNFNSVAITSGRNVTVSDVSGIDLGASTVSGTLNLTANGAVTDSGNVVVGGATTLAAGAANDITLNNNDNFSTVAITSGRNVTLNDQNAIDLGVSTVSGNLNVTASGAITDSGNLTVSGATTLAAGAGNDITLNDNNNFGTVAITSGRNVVLNDLSGIDLGASTISGTLGVTARGSITQSGALAVSGGASTFTIDTVLGADVLLGSQANNFGGQTVAFNTANGGTIRDLSFRNVSPSAALPALPAGLRNLTVQFDAAGINLPGLVLSGNLALTAGGLVDFTAATASSVAGTMAITTSTGGINDSGSGSLAVTGGSTLSAGAGNDVVLNNNNDFSTVAITSGRNVSLNDVNSIDLGASTVAANLNVTANGPITDSGSVVVAGTATLAAGAANDVTLNNNNDFDTVVINSARNVVLNDLNGINLGNLSAAGTLAVSAGGLVDFTGAAASTVSGAMSITTTSGGITDSGSGTLTVGGVSTLSAGAGNDITLNNNNNFSTVVVNSGRNVTLADSGAISLGNLTVSGNLGISAAGVVDFMGAGANTVIGTLGIITTSGGIADNGLGSLTVGGASTLAAGAANDITLNNNNNFGTVQIASGRNVSLNDVNAIDLGASTVSGTLTVRSHGNITESGALNVLAGASTFTVDTAVGADVLLGSQANHFGSQTVTINTANGGLVRDVSFRNADAAAQYPLLPSGLRNVTLFFDTAGINVPALAVSGVLSLNSGAGVTQSGNISASGLQVTAVGPVTLDGLNQVTTVAGSVTGSGNSFSFTDQGTLTVGTVDGVPGITTANGNITLTADNMEIGAAIDSGSANTTLQPLSIGQTINLGSEVAGSLSLRQAELNQVSANDLVVGSTIAGSIFGATAVVTPPTVNRLVLVSSGGTIQVFSAQLAGLLAAGTLIPTPKLDVNSFSGTSIDVESAAKILPPGSIGTLYLQVPFEAAEEEVYRVEDVSKWTSGRIAALGTTTGPQTAK